MDKPGTREAEGRANRAILEGSLEKSCGSCATRHSGTGEGRNRPVVPMVDRSSMLGAWDKTPKVQAPPFALDVHDYRTPSTGRDRNAAVNSEGETPIVVRPGGTGTRCGGDDRSTNATSSGEGMSVGEGNLVAATLCQREYRHRGLYPCLETGSQHAEFRITGMSKTTTLARGKTPDAHDHGGE